MNEKTRLSYCPTCLATTNQVYEIWYALPEPIEKYRCCVCGNHVQDIIKEENKC